VSPITPLVSTSLSEAKGFSDVTSSMMSAKVPARSPSEVVPRISSRLTREIPHLVEQVVELVDLQAERVGHFLFRGLPAEALLDLAVGALELAALLTHGARHPVERSQLVEDRALDPELGVGLELAVLVGIVLLDGIHQADHACIVEVVEVDVRGQPDGDPVDDVTDQRCVLEDDLFLEFRSDLAALILGILQQRFHESFAPARLVCDWVFPGACRPSRPRVVVRTGREHAACQAVSRTRRGRRRAGPARADALLERATLRIDDGFSGRSEQRPELRRAAAAGGSGFRSCAGASELRRCRACRLTDSCFSRVAKYPLVLRGRCSPLSGGSGGCTAGAYPGRRTTGGGSERGRL